MLTHDIQSTLGQLSNLLLQLDDQTFTRAHPQLGIASIGEHTRHIIEMFNCLHTKYENGTINYDARERNRLIETSVQEALKHINFIVNNLDKPNKPLWLLQKDNSSIATNYERELLYNLEHCIHHQALIKVSLYDATDIILSSHFGVAPSTIAYRMRLKMELN
jgi:hypothetical protein